MDRQHTVDNSLEPTVRAFNQLSPQSQEIATSLVRQLAQRERINVSLTASSGLQASTERILR